MDETKYNGALETELAAARSETVAISETDFAESMRMAEDIGKVKMARAMASHLNLGTIRWFDHMKATKAYKGKILVSPDGRTFRPETFEELCDGMGFSKNTINESLQNFAALGPQYLEEAQNLGLKVRDLRKVRKALKDAPVEKRDEIFLALREARDSSEELKTALDVVCGQLIQSKDEKKKLEDKIGKLEEDSLELKENYRAQGKVLETKSQQYDELNEKYIRATSPRPADVEERKLAMRENARKSLDEACLNAVLAVERLGALAEAIIGAEDIDGETAAHVHERVSLAVADMGRALNARMIDIDLSAEFKVDYGEEAE